MDDLSEQPSFTGIRRLYGHDGLERLQASRVCVIGLGGVGSWTVEVLARSGVGAITLVDADAICTSNINRQIHASHSTTGQQKTSVLQQRVLDIAPDCRVEIVDRFLTPSNTVEIVGEGYDFIVDAIDSMYSKTELISYCRRRRQKIVVCGGAGGKVNPLAIRTGDLSRSIMDPLLRKVRKELRYRYGFSRNPKRSFGIPCIYSTEEVSLGEDCQITSGSKNCETGYGSACHVTAQFGLLAAGIVINRLTLKDQKSQQ